MDRVTLAVMGVGNVRCTPPVLATLASYFGERPLEIVLFDADEERLDLFDRLARTFLAFTKSTNMLSSTANPDEALASAQRVIVQIDVQCARSALKLKHSPTEIQYRKALKQILANVSPNAETLSLVGEVKLPLPTYRRIDWPSTLRIGEEPAVPHQALRWIHGEEYPFEFFAEHEDSPLKSWLDDPTSAPLAKSIAE